MKIDHYRFGLIRVGGREYEKDVEVRSGGEVIEWWRKEGHVFNPEDVERALDQDPDFIVLGTGNHGVAQVPHRTRERIRKAGVILVIDKTEEAVDSFNRLVEKSEKGGLEKKIIGLFHLTC